MSFTVQEARAAFFSCTFGLTPHHVAVPDTAKTALAPKQCGDARDLSVQVRMSEGE